MSLQYTFAALPLYYEQVFNLGEHLYVTGIAYDLEYTPDVVVTTGYRVTESSEGFGSASGFFLQDKLEDLSGVTIKNGTWSVDTTTFTNNAETDKRIMAISTMDDYAFSLLEGVTSTTNFIINVDTWVVNQRKKYYMRSVIQQHINSGYPQNGTIEYWRWFRHEAEISATPDVYAGDIIRLYNGEATYYEQVVVTQVVSPGYFFIPNVGGYYRGYAILDVTPLPIAPGNFVTTGYNDASLGQWSYFQLVSRPSGTPGGCAYVAFGHVSDTEIFYVAGYDIVNQSWDICSVSPITKILTRLATVTDVGLSYNTWRLMSVTSQYNLNTDETTVFITCDSVQKISHVFSGEILGKVGLFTNNSITKFNNLVMTIPVIETSESAADITWCYSNKTSVVVNKRARIVSLSVDFNTSMNGTMLCIPKVKGFTVYGIWNNTSPMSTDPVWGNDGTLLWESITNAQTVDLPVGKYMQLRFTLRV